MPVTYHRFEVEGADQDADPALLPPAAQNRKSSRSYGQPFSWRASLERHGTAVAILLLLVTLVVLICDVILRLHDAQAAAALAAAAAVTRTTTVEAATLAFALALGRQIVTEDQNVAYILRPPTPLGQQRYDFARDNIARAFPGFFTFRPSLWSPLNDSRIVASRPTSKVWRATLNNVMNLVDIWTDIHTNPAHVALPETHWFFIFEDDVNVSPTPHTDEKFSYTSMLREFLTTPKVIEDGIFYFGVCGAEFNSTGPDAPDVLHATSAPWFESRLGSGYCAHAMGMTKGRARTLFWDMALRGNTQHRVSDIMLLHWGRQRGGIYIFGSNIISPIFPDHQGILYQDRAHVPSLRDPDFVEPPPKKKKPAAPTASHIAAKPNTGA